MATTTASFSRDGNRVPITNYGFRVQKVQTLTGNNTTVATPLFSVTGTIKVYALYGMVTTTLGTNVTTAFWRLNDQTAQPAISLATGTTISGAAVGSQIIRLSVASVALTVKSAATGNVLDPVAATAPDVFIPFICMQKVGSIETDIEFVYTTTNTPTSGVIQHIAYWLPLSDDGNLVAL